MLLSYVSMFQESLEEEKRKSKMLETVLIDQLCRFLSMHTVSFTNYMHT